MAFYVDSEDGPIKEGALCPECGSTHTNFEPVFRNWRCEECSLSWGEDEEKWESHNDVSPEELEVCEGDVEELGYSNCPFCQEFSGRPLISGYNYCRICDSRW